MIRKKSRKGRYHLIDNDTDILIGIFPSYKSALHEVDRLLDNEMYREIKMIHEREAIRR